MSSPVQPIIVIKKKAGHGGHHGGAWKVAYADFVTAMMAFFLVMWLVSQKPDVKAGVSGYFRDPIAAMDGGRGVLPGADSLDQPAPRAPLQSAEPEVDRQRLEAVVEELESEIARNPIFQGLKDQIEFKVTPEGLRIDLIEQADSSFFDSGSAKMRVETEQLLALIANQLALLGYDLDIEGHTDSHQYSSVDGYSNWELSADRANAARRIIQRNGVSQSQVTSVRGFADREPRIPDNPLDPRNRRVSILVKSPAMRKTTGTSETGMAGAAPAPAPAASSDAGDASAARVAAEVAAAAGAH